MVGIGSKGGNTLKNQKYDEAFEVSQSVDKGQAVFSPKKGSTTVVNKPFDEAMDFSDDESKFGGESKNARKSASEPLVNVRIHVFVITVSFSYLP